jgi:thiamine kinase-like enzyme
MNFAADMDLIQRDSHIPGLSLILDNSAVTGLLHRHFPHMEVQNVRAYYVRYKPHTNCLVAYQATTDETALYLYATAFTGRNHDKLNALASEIQTWTGNEIGLNPVGLVDREQHIGIRFLAYDRKLAALPNLLTDKGRSELMGRALPQRLDFQHCTLDIMRYKPERRLVARITSRNQNAATINGITSGTSLLVKAYSPKEFELARINAKHPPKTRTLVLQPIVGKSATYDIQAFGWLLGAPVDHLLFNSRRQDITIDDTAGPSLDRATLVEAIGNGLVDLHTSTPLKGKWQLGSSLWAELKQSSEAIYALVPDTRDQLECLLDRVETYMKATPKLKCPIHNDCSADQFILLKDGRLAMIDWDRAGLGEPTADLGAFAANLYVKTLQPNMDTVSPGHQEFAGTNLTKLEADAMIDDLLEVYESVAPTYFSPERFACHLILRLLRLAPEPFRYRRTDWQIQLQALLQYADEASHAF